MIIWYWNYNDEKDTELRQRASLASATTTVLFWSALWFDHSLAQSRMTRKRRSTFIVTSRTVRLRGYAIVHLWTFRLWPSPLALPLCLVTNQTITFLRRFLVYLHLPFLLRFIFPHSPLWSLKLFGWILVIEHEIDAMSEHFEFDSWVRLRRPDGEDRGSGGLSDLTNFGRTIAEIVPII